MPQRQVLPDVNLEGDDVRGSRGRRITDERQGRRISGVARESLERYLAS